MYRQKHLLQLLIEEKIEKSIHKSYEQSKNLVPIISRKQFDNNQNTQISINI